MAARRTFAGAELRLGFEVVHVFNAVLDEERLLEALQLQFAHAAVQFLEHGLEDGIFFGIGAGGLHAGREASAQQSKTGRQRRVIGRIKFIAPPSVHRRSRLIHVRCSLFPAPSRSGNGQNRRTRRALRLALRFHFAQSMAGATALTGTVPDSAPHSPLKTSLLSPVARMRFIAASGVPTMLTPRTSSSGRPST